MSWVFSMESKSDSSGTKSVNLKYLDKKSSEAKPYIATNKSMQDDRYNGEICIDTDSKQLVGWILIGDSKDQGFICNLVVIQQYRRQGIATQLMKDAISKYGGYDLTVLKTNVGAIALYKKLGFVIQKADMKDDDHYYMVLKSGKNKDIIAEIKEIFSHISYGLRDPKTNKPWKNTHKSTTGKDYDENWRLGTPEQTIKAGVGNCYDTVAISRKYLSETSMKYRIFYMAPSDVSTSHAFLIYQDYTGTWKWLECSWSPHIKNSLTSTNPTELAKQIVLLMANAEDKEIHLFEVSKYPPAGCDIKEFETECSKQKYVGSFKPEKK